MQLHEDPKFLVHVGRIVEGVASCSARARRKSETPTDARPPLVTEKPPEQVRVSSIDDDLSKYSAENPRGA